jgi:integrase
LSHAHPKIRQTRNAAGENADEIQSPHVMVYEMRRETPTLDTKFDAEGRGRGGVSLPSASAYVAACVWYKIANDGQDTRAVQHYLGHKNIQYTVRYTELSPERFKSFWED